MSLFSFRLFLLFAFGVGALSANAQQTIIVSKPADVDSDKANSFMDSTRRLNAGDYKAPLKLLNVEPNLPPPSPPAYYQNNWDSSAADAANKRRNWTLLTPEQILGVQTPEDILGLNKQDDKKKMSLEEQFLLRQRQPLQSMATNGSASALFLGDDSNPFRDNNRSGWQSTSPTSPGYSSSYQQAIANQPDSYNSLRRLFNNNVNASDVSGGNAQGDQYQNQNSIWTSPFAQPTRPKVTQDQLDNMERFRALMQPSATQTKTQTTPTYSNTKPSSGWNSGSFFDPQPNINPAGRTYTALESDVIHPKGLTPLPGITGPVSKPDNTQRPDWKAKLPPWMLNGPQPHNY